MTTMTPQEIAQTSDLTEAFRAIFTDSEMMLAWLASAPNLRGKLLRARHAYYVAENPRNRHGLTKSDIPESVLAAILAFEAECSRAAEPVRVAIREARADGQAWDTTWGIVWADDTLYAMGFGPGDSTLLGVYDAEWNLR